MDYMHLSGTIDISIVRSKSESAAFKNRNQQFTAPIRPISPSTVRVVSVNHPQMCCNRPSVSRLRSCFQIFRLHLYNNHKVAIALGVIAIIIGIVGLVFTLGISSLISYCLITGGSVLIGGTIYHSASIAMNCGPCKTRHHLDEYSDSELEASNH